MRYAFIITLTCATAAFVLQASAAPGVGRAGGIDYRISGRLGVVPLPAVEARRLAADIASFEASYSQDDVDALAARASSHVESTTTMQSFSVSVRTDSSRCDLIEHDGTERTWYGSEELRFDVGPHPSSKVPLIHLEPASKDAAAGHAGGQAVIVTRLPPQYCPTLATLGVPGFSKVATNAVAGATAVDGDNALPSVVTDARRNVRHEHSVDRIAGVPMIWRTVTEFPSAASINRRLVVSSGFRRTDAGVVPATVIDLYVPQDGDGSLKVTHLDHVMVPAPEKGLMPVVGDAGRTIRVLIHDARHPRAEDDRLLELEVDGVTPIDQAVVQAQAVSANPTGTTALAANGPIAGSHPAWWGLVGAGGICIAVTVALVATRRARMHG